MTAAWHSAMARTAALTLLIAAAACRETPTATSTPTPLLTATPSPLTACPLGPVPSVPQVLLNSLPAPDDMVIDKQDRLLFSDINAGTVSRLNADGSVERLAGGLSEPEGMVVQADGRVLVAEQGRNRIDLIDPIAHSWTVWRNFPNRTSNAGIDGIGPILAATDASGRPLAHGGDVIVPDSPNGVTWAVTPDGKSATQIASGMTRPVDAAADAAGRIFVADEGGALWVLDPARRRLTTLPTPDDVVIGHRGEIFVTTLGDNDIHQLDAQGRRATAITGIAQPQGIALDGADNLYYTEFTGRRIDRILRTFILGAPSVKRVATNQFDVCPAVIRAPGFRDRLRFQPVPLDSGWIGAAVEPGADSSGALVVRTTQASVTLRVSDEDAPLQLDQTIALPR